MGLGLPHEYPFVFVDRVEPDDVDPEDPGSEDPGSEVPRNRAILGVTAGADTAAENAASLPATLLLEAMAQATLALMLADAPEDEDGEGRGLLVGIDEATFDESLIHQPPRPGDRLVSRCEVRGRFGRMAKVAAWMERDGVRVASAEMLLAGG